MKTSFADSKQPSPFSEASSAQGAADELRAAAGGAEGNEISSTEEKARLLKEAAVKKATELRDFAGERATEFKEVAAEKASHLRDSASEKAQQLRGAASEQWQDTRIKAEELHASMEESVRANPTKGVLIAAGIGFLAGLIIRR